MADHADDLHAEQTEGFKVGEKKTIDEYQQLGKFHSFSEELIACIYS
jgi:hypothetical protein